MGYCVNKEYGDQFWAFNDYLFTVDKVGIYQASYMDTIFQYFNFDVKKLNDCINDPVNKEIVEGQVKELRKTNLYGTPTVFINGKALVGPKPYRVYKTLLNKFIFF